MQRFTHLQLVIKSVNQFGIDIRRLFVGKVWKIHLILHFHQPNECKNCFTNIVSATIFTLFTLFGFPPHFGSDFQFCLLALALTSPWARIAITALLPAALPKIIFVNILLLDVILWEIFSKWFVCLCIYIYLCGIFLLRQPICWPKLGGGRRNCPIHLQLKHSL